MKTVFISIITLAGLSLFGADATNPPPPHEKNPALEKALKECSQQTKKDSSGRPDLAEMDACMSAKGFKKPPRPPHEGQHPPINGSANATN